MWGGHSARLIKFGGNHMNKELLNRIIVALMLVAMVLSAMSLGYRLGVTDERMRNYEYQIEMLKAGEK